MPDLTRLQNSQPVQLVDANDLLVCDISTVAPSGTESGLIVRTLPSGTHTVAGTVTAIASGTQAVAGTVTSVPSGTSTVTGAGTAGTADAGVVTIQGIASMTAIKIDGSAVTQPVSGTVTAITSGTQTVSGTVTNVPSGTYTVTATGMTVSGAGTAGTAAAGVVTIQGIASMTPISVSGTTTATPTGTYTVAAQKSATSTLSNVTVTSAVSIQLLAANSSRLLATFFNSGANSVYIKWGTAASATSHTIELFTNGFYEMHVPIYTGAIEAISSTGTNTIRVTEI